VRQSGRKTMTGSSVHCVRREERVGLDWIDTRQRGGSRTATACACVVRRRGRRRSTCWCLSGLVATHNSRNCQCQSATARRWLGSGALLNYKYCSKISRTFFFTCSDENGWNNLVFISISIFFWRKLDRVRKTRVWKQNRDMRMHENKQIRMESRKIKLE
jgi:hypothetical protein